MSQYLEQDKPVKKVLIADDEEHILSILKISLKAEGYEVHTASDGEEAIAVFGYIQPDICILDIMLPKLDGWQVLSFIKSSKNKCPVIMLSAKDNMPDINTSLRQGADAHITKPFDIGRVIGKVKQLLK